MPVENRRPSRRKLKAPSQEVYVELPEMTPVQRLTVLMAERMRLAEFVNVQAVAPGYNAPPMIKGAHSDHRPSVAAQFKTGAPLLLDVLVPGQDDALTAARWQLFSSAVEMSGGQFHVATPEMPGPRSAASDYVKRKARAFGVDVHKIWEV